MKEFIETLTILQKVGIFAIIGILLTAYKICLSYKAKQPRIHFGVYQWDQPLIPGYETYPPYGVRISAGNESCRVHNVSFEDKNGEQVVFGSFVKEFPKELAPHEAFTFRFQSMIPKHPVVRAVITFENNKVRKSNYFNVAKGQ